ncbi:hypothetical protein CW751_04590 [Brumimicrobium salinarum]|uniref:Uncharacterized protein n=1 Tax=Brumimicrobium salinarum TaxID=2058658 RepID=A0A2I0R441_9FLAO|nr:hypothetical protein [Brumimicrobium salinarum]PKR81338.1 hypothetical protein CW751_04590 [Brumimicrobium salinarum]
MYLQVLAFGLVLVLSPCSVRNSLQDALGVAQTDVSNKSKTTNNFEELCSTLNVDNLGDHPSELINTTPEIPSFGRFNAYSIQNEWIIDEDISLSQYEAPYTIKDKTPLYLLHQQFKVYLQEA